MPSKLTPGLATPLVACMLFGAGCGAFSLRPEPVVPDPPPVTRVDVAGTDTTYVVRAASYALLSRDRQLMWHRTTLDDAAWRFRWLLDAAPSAIAVRVDTAPIAAPPAARWEGLPLVAVSLGPRARQATGRGRRTLGEEAALEIPELGGRAARVWMQSLALPASAWWFEAGAARLVASRDARVAVVRQTATAKRLAAAASLVASTPPAPDNAVVDTGLDARRPDAVPVRRGGARSAVRPDLRDVGGAASVATQAASLLLFLRDRDPAFVAALPARLREGRAFAELLAASAALPRTLDALDAEWRKWLRARPTVTEARPPRDRQDRGAPPP